MKMSAMHLAAALVKYSFISRDAKIFTFTQPKWWCAMKDVGSELFTKRLCTLYLNCHGFLSVSYFPYYNAFSESISSNFNFIGALPHNTRFKAIIMIILCYFIWEIWMMCIEKRGRASSSYTYSFFSRSHSLYLRRFLGVSVCLSLSLVHSCFLVQFSSRRNSS